MPRILVYLLLIYSTSAFAAESAPTFPLWDNHESVSEYAKRVNLPPTQTLDLGNGVKLELVLIPAGKFKMGTPEHEKPWVGQLLLGVSASLLVSGIRSRRADRFISRPSIYTIYWSQISGRNSSIQYSTRTKR